MKIIIPFIYLLLLTGTLNAQTTLHASTSNKEICYWNSGTSDFDKCGSNDEYSSMFTLNAQETMFTHITNEIKSTYYIDKKELVEKCNCNKYDVTSDVGNKYTFIVDLDNKMFKIMALGHAEDKDDYLIIFTIKSSWKD